MQRDTALGLMASQIGQWGTMARGDTAQGPQRHGPARADRRMQEAEARGELSQLGRADVWIYTDEHIVPAQLKVNPFGVPPFG